MPAHNREFPWLSYYKQYNFFEGRMREHSKVSDLKKINAGLYDVSMKDGRVLRVFICECYSFGGGEYYEATQNLGKVDAVVINSNWCGYSPEVKIACQAEHVGIYDIAGFMAAINMPNHWEYMTESEKKMLKK